jgi:hypothetical protein
MKRLAAQVPKPRINLVLYAGVLAPKRQAAQERGPLRAPWAAARTTGH